MAAYNLAEQSQREPNGCGRHAVPHVGDLQRSPRPVAHHTSRELIKHTDIQLNRSHDAFALYLATQKVTEDGMMYVIGISYKFSIEQVGRTHSGPLGNPSSNPGVGLARRRDTGADCRVLHWLQNPLQPSVSSAVDQARRRIRSTC